MRRSFAGVAIVALLVVAATVVTIGAAETSYGLTVVSAVDTPMETIEIDGNEYEIDEIGVIEPGEPIEMRVTSSTDYDVLLYNTDQKIEHDVWGSADDTVVTMGGADDDFDTGSLDPGTYMLSLEPNGEDRELTPVVVEGYDLDLEYPTSAERGSTVTFEATVEPIDDRTQPNEVEVVIWDGEDATELTLDHIGGTSYETTVSLSTFDTGTYSVYGAVFGDETVYDYPTALAVDNGASLTVTEEESDGDDENDDSGDEAAEDGDGDESESGGGDGNESVTGGGDGNESESNDGNDDSGDGAADDESDDGSDGSDTDDDTNDDGSDDEGDGVIEPNQSGDADDGESTNDDELGASVAVQMGIAIGAVLSIAAGRARA